MSGEFEKQRPDADAMEPVSEMEKQKTAKGPGISFGKLFGGGKKQPESGNEAKSGTASGKDVRKLTRTELLELLIDETREADRLTEENEELREELAQCRAQLEKVGSLDAVIARLEAILERRA